MARQIETVLSDILAEYGLAICNDHRRFEALLNDLCPAERKSTTVLVRSMTEGVVRSLLDNHEVAPRDFRFAQLTARLERQLALTTEAAAWAVRTWESVLPRPDRARFDVVHSHVGTGVSSNNLLSLRPGLALFFSSHSGSGNFVVELLGPDSKFVCLIANTIGPDTSRKPVRIPFAGDYRIEVTSARSDWTIESRQLSSSGMLDYKSAEWTGSGQDFFIVHLLKAVPVAMHFTYEGYDNFQVSLLNGNGYVCDLLANEVGNCELVKNFSVDRDMDYIFDVNGSGRWRIEVRQELSTALA